MTITTKENANGRISAYFVDGVKTRKGEIDSLIYDAARAGKIIEVDYYIGEQFKALTRSCYRNLKVVFTRDDELKLMTESAAEVLGYRVIKRFTGAYWGLNVCQVELQIITEPDPDDYVVTPDAQDVATDSEINNAATEEITEADPYDLKPPICITVSQRKYYSYSPVVVKFDGKRVSMKDAVSDIRLFFRNTPFQVKNQHGDTFTISSHIGIMRIAQAYNVIEHELREAASHLFSLATEERIWEELKLDFILEDYAVTPDAQDVAVDAEIEAANGASSTALVPVSFYQKHDIITQELTTGNCSITINDEYVTFRNFSIVSINADRKLGMGYRRTFFGNKKIFYTVTLDPHTNLRFLGPEKPIAVKKIADIYLVKEHAAAQDKFFTAFFKPYQNRPIGEFTINVILTYADGREHHFYGCFDQYRLAQKFIADVKKFVGNVPCQFFTKTRNHSRDTQLTWNDPHNYDTVGDISDNAVRFFNSRIAIHSHVETQSFADFDTHISELKAAHELAQKLVKEKRETLRMARVELERAEAYARETERNLVDKLLHQYYARDAFRERLKITERKSG